MRSGGVRTSTCAC